MQIECAAKAMFPLQNFNGMFVAKIPDHIDLAGRSIEVTGVFVFDPHVQNLGRELIVLDRRNVFPLLIFPMKILPPTIL